MLDGPGINFEQMGLALGYARDIRAADKATAEATSAAWRERHVRDACVSGRLAQISALVDALHELYPEHPLLRETGLVWSDGEPQVAWQVPYDAAYDAVAQRRGIPTATRAMAPAEAAYRRVLAEPIETRRFFLSKRFFFRSDEHRSLRGAERARRLAAETAYEETL